jgi:hypothetical protein
MVLLNFLKKFFDRIKAFPKVFKGLSLRKIIDYFKSHRLLAIIYLAIVVVVIIILFLLINYFQNQQTEIAVSKTDEKSATADVQDLSLTIPENAYPYPKSFTINKIPRDAAYNQYKQLGNFYGDIYELSPNDGRNDLALEPMTYTYRIPNEFYFGDEYFNFELLYIENKENPVVKVFSGGEIIQTENNRPILRAKGFHGSLVGLRVNNPVKQSLGLKKIIEKPDNLKPDLLLVPGIDINFQGFLPNTISNTNPQGNNLWEVTFEDRSIWVYDYPLTETRSANYVREAQNFFTDISKTSYIRLEAEKLANSLLESEQEYDLIAHGIGGIIARYAVENYPITNIRKIVLISVPNTGTNIVNPSFLNLLYGKDTQVLSQIYGLDADTIRYLTRNNMGYLENVNVFYTDILPFAEVIKTLENSLRKDISYFFIGGNQPDFDAELEDSQFAKFYPENTFGKGDGIVSVYSAIYPSLEEAENEKDNVLSKIVPYSFYDIFLQQQTLQLIRSYLEEGIEVVEVPDYQDDTFREWMFDNSDSTKTNSIGEHENDLFASTITLNPATVIQEEPEKVPNNLPTQTDNVQDLDDWKKETSPKEAEKDESAGTQTTENNIEKKETNGQAENTSNSKIENNNLEKTISIIESIKTSKDSEPIQYDNDAVNGSNQMETFTPKSSKWNTNLFPDTFVNIQNMIIYNLTRHKFPFDSSPYGIETVGDLVYIFDNLGITLFKNGTFERISDGRVNAFFSDSRKLYVVQDNILTEYSNGEPSKMSYLMFEAPILSFAVTDSHQYYLLSQNGLTFETPSKSFKLNGHYGQILLYGVYPYIITDAGVYLFNGKDCELVYEPYNKDIQLESGIINNDSLYLLASDYSLRAISLDGEKILLDTVHNTGGIKILKTPEKIIVAGRNKFNIIDYSYKKPEGTFFEIPSTDKVLDVSIFEGHLLVLVREGDSTFLKKMAIME